MILFGPFSQRREKNLNPRVFMNSRVSDPEDPLPLTPRTVIAMRRVGITPDVCFIPVTICIPHIQELRPKVIHEFYIPGDLPEKQRLRFKHFEVYGICILASFDRLVDLRGLNLC